ncbi:MAG: adenylyltransferase/cytidyltransferase family protein [Clostridia bacterium]|nr:adenylyltransferase/cytidyltransferase family protein [Clostridia bacterium]
MICQREDLRKIRETNMNKKIVVALGSFDLFHYEHLRYLSDAKQLGDILVVGIKDDKAVSQKNVNRPIIKQEWRVAIIDALKCVDYTYICSNNCEKNNTELIEDLDSQNWWNLFNDMFANLQPDILYFEENEKLKNARIKASKKYNFRLESRERTELISTSKIINKIRNN